MRAYGTTEGPLNWLCIVYALVYIPGAFLTGPIVSAVGTRWTFVLAMSADLAWLSEEARVKQLYAS